MGEGRCWCRGESERRATEEERALLKDNGGYNREQKREREEERKKEQEREREREGKRERVVSGGGEVEVELGVTSPLSVPGQSEGALLFSRWVVILVNLVLLVPGAQGQTHRTP